jgi:hypothetical protein
MVQKYVFIKTSIPNGDFFDFRLGVLCKMIIPIVQHVWKLNSGSKFQ